MALGGGEFITQNKILPGSYINFVAASRATAILSDRGIVAMPLVMSWGPEGEIFEVTKDDFVKNSRKIFGYDYASDEMLGMRELFKNAQRGLFFRLGSDAAYAGNNYAEAIYPGTRGNDISFVISKNKDNEGTFDVKTLLAGVVADIQKSVANTTNLKPNGYVNWKGNVALTETAKAPLTGGKDATAATTGNYSDFLEKVESYSFNTLAVADQTANSMFEDFTVSMREDKGVKFQTVLYKSTANNEGIISVENEVVEKAGETVANEMLVYWVAGAEAGCGVNKTLTNRTYDGELSINVDYTQKQLEDAITNGKFLFHRVGNSVRVLEDINTLTEYDDEKNPDFSDNQVIRVLDQVGNDIAVLFNEHYLGKMPNDESSRIGLWNDIVTHHKQLESLRAIENFDSKHVTVEKGEGKKSVIVTDIVTPVCAMTKLYMTVVVE